MHLVWILFGAVLLNLLSGIILTICSYYKGLVSISRLLVDTEMGRGLTAIFTGITTLCTIFTLIFTLREFGPFHLLAFAFVFELCAVFSATLGLALYPIMVRSATSINSSAKRLSEGISRDTSKIFRKYGRDTSEERIKDILEFRNIIEQIIKEKKKGAGFWVCFLILIYYYAFSFALIGIALLTVGIGSMVL